MKNLNRHIRKDKSKWILTFIAGVLAFACIGGLALSLKKHVEDKQEETPPIESVEDSVGEEFEGAE